MNKTGIIQGHFFSVDTRVFISCNACKRRELDSILIKKYLQLNNYTVVEDIDLANIIIFFTCSFSKEMSLDSIKKLDNYSKNYDIVFVFGCFPVIGIHDFKYPDNVITINNDELQKIELFFPPIVMGISHIKDGNDIYYDDVFNDDVFLIRISKGCLGNCSYCAIKKAIGILKSKTMPHVLEEVEFAISQNYSYIRLVADDGGGYGIDLGLDIIQLLKKISGYNQIKGIEFEINPKWILKYKEGFVEFMKNNLRLFNKITVPMQTASIKLLKQMNRMIDLHEFDTIMAEIMGNNDFSTFFITHIITGYPSETQEDQNVTLDFLNQHRFNQINVFPFTLHPNSPIGSVYKTDDVIIYEKTNSFVERLYSIGYDVFESSKSESNQWQHVILRLSSN